MKKIFIPLLIIFSIIFAIFLGKNFIKNSENTTISQNTFYKNFEENSIKYILSSDKNIFTQGLYVYGENFMISSGAPSGLTNTKTQLGIMNRNGNFEPKVEFPKNEYFGEGITEFDNKIFWTFWKNKKIFVFDKNFAKINEINIGGEGWGLTSDGEHLILSDGSEFLSFFDKNFEKIKTIQVTENNLPIDKINELEYIDGKIFANIWLTNDIVAIDSESGKVVARYNFDFLKNIELTKNPTTQEMNGIAFDKTKNEIIITGKMWENLYVFDIKDFYLP